jgi:hypothetical protein
MAVRFLSTCVRFLLYLRQPRKADKTNVVASNETQSALFLRYRILNNQV